MANCGSCSHNKSATVCSARKETEITVTTRLHSDVELHIRAVCDLELLPISHPLFRMSIQGGTALGSHKRVFFVPSNSRLLFSFVAKSAAKTVASISDDPVNGNVSTLAVAVNGVNITDTFIASVPFCSQLITATDLTATDGHCLSDANSPNTALPASQWTIGSKLVVLAAVGSITAVTPVGDASSAAAQLFAPVA